ncbi:MAG: carbamoyltransferase HypF [Coriobacteriales bacterium]|jgi:hydrogenase maturation protein HypF|nr:carbamoyltransferase HypF [Coriobacteriales bacterium]
MAAVDIFVTGVVQGVGFRPYIYRLARSLAVKGWVLNQDQGVHIHAEADHDTLDSFYAAIKPGAPAVARVDALRRAPASVEGCADFSIHLSEQTGQKSIQERTLVGPDLAICEDCLRELHDPNDRRYHYPFINCTNCGPRYTIIDDLPYDRAQTAMADFEMCSECQAEYDDPSNRRFHAQPDACFSCGPHLNASHTREESDAEIVRAAACLRKGGIVACKDLGGYHLLCDATSKAAIKVLRKRKQRPDKPLAILISDALSEQLALHRRQREVLRSKARPILLLPKHLLAPLNLAQSVAPALAEVGVMLPATALQYLLIEAFGAPLVATSGNVSGAPIIGDNTEAHQRLAAVADFFLDHDRAVRSRYDDSVVRLNQADEVSFIRRARGYAPLPVVGALPPEIQENGQIIAFGAQMKATFCLIAPDPGKKRYQAFVSQHLGDLASKEAQDNYLATLMHNRRLVGANPVAVACDLHPGYFTTKLAQSFQAKYGFPLIQVQHHHAHFAACLGEHDFFGQAIGVVFDGTGYGEDGSIWGGEILCGSIAQVSRFAHLPNFKLVGGDAAVKHPLHTAYVLTHDQTLLTKSERELLDAALASGQGVLECSSAGRLFDAKAAALGVCSEPSYDGQAACELEALLWSERADPDLRAQALLFHQQMRDFILAECEAARSQTALDTVALCGGCFNNRWLCHEVKANLEQRGFKVLLPRQLPCGDGAISYGQALVALCQAGRE